MFFKKKHITEKIQFYFKNVDVKMSISIDKNTPMTNRMTKAQFSSFCLHFMLVVLLLVPIHVHLSVCQFVNRVKEIHNTKMGKKKVIVETLLYNYLDYTILSFFLDSTYLFVYLSFNISIYLLFYLPIYLYLSIKCLYLSMN